MPNFTGGTDTSILSLVFNATAWTSIAQNNGSPATNLYVSLHNANPAASGNQSTNETAYTNYARVAVARTSAGWTVGGSSPTVNVTNAAQIAFAQCGASGDTLTHWGIGLASSGAGTLLCYGPIGPGPGYGFSCTSASPGSLTVPGSSLSVNGRVSVYANAESALPTGITEGTVYYVGTASSITVSLSTTSGNANPVNTSSVGAGFLIVQNPLVVSSGVTPTFAAGQLIYYLA